MEPLTGKEIEAELKLLTQKHVILTGFFGLLVGILQKEGASTRLLSQLSLHIEEARPLSPTVSGSEWDALLKLVSSFSEIATSHD